MADKSTQDKHVVAAGLFAEDAGSTPAASTIWHVHNMKPPRSLSGLAREGVFRT